MAHRMQITLRDDQYERLRDEARRSGLSIAELIRRALERRYGHMTAEEKLRALDDSFGAWGEPPGEDRGAYPGELRGAGLGHRVDGDEPVTGGS